MQDQQAAALEAERARSSAHEAALEAEVAELRVLAASKDATLQETASASAARTAVLEAQVAELQALAAEKDAALLEHTKALEAQLQVAEQTAVTQRAQLQAEQASHEVRSQRVLEDVDVSLVRGCAWREGVCGCKSEHGGTCSDDAGVLQVIYSVRGCPTTLATRMPCLLRALCWAPEQCPTCCPKHPPYCAIHTMLLSAPHAAPHAPRDL